jgi:hypothetical protein
VPRPRPLAGDPGAQAPARHPGAGPRPESSSARAQADPGAGGPRRQPNFCSCPRARPRPRAGARADLGPRGPCANHPGANEAAHSLPDRGANSGKHLGLAPPSGYELRGLSFLSSLFPGSS